MKKNQIIFTGGGSGGHVVPALTLISKLKSQNFEIIYFGSYTGIESKLTEGKVDRYIGISTGKIRRYLSVENFIDIFKVFIGLIQSLWKIFFLKKGPLVIFSMGGFVSVPVVIAGKLLGAKVFIHEQTTRVGLANKVASKFADKVFVSFEDSLKFFPQGKVQLSGYPVRDIFLDKTIQTKSYKGIDLENKRKPLIFVTGGGNGSKLLNDKIKHNLEHLTGTYDIIHQVGASYIEEYRKLENESYKTADFLGDEMPDIFKAADVVLSRSGAGTVAELMALGKPSLFIPLKIAQKNEQFHNAMAAKESVGSIVVEEDDFGSIDLLATFEKIRALDKDKGPALRNNAVDFLLAQIRASYE
ncbi:glycosyltransferase [Bacteriovorax sp. DB6_IX]|uniref:UDP-N-acetylglucosamine--N-acetylmuramyl- (pentapeptide) pyrophosphoryl-undecaprenol N-acetylglucosamine transferase n=1 Tax=Bacteriovorax sp. DB6_IX TaxID=1353530 RepID=UPI00038A3417|nr:UDP-N-acetylglucosamine--N-acetylmuramyl-(pentapeptide) pyrophosphoryl-undecaprenol N-acetylglucosamine transferase [Bacteriovorax sp. DB6_IX]EQC51073.1 putative undecaprenyldiphospho-muramoylpentapeptide beta-N-acetylglucosaminyltransferase [Bacteriovorax sp. DB6_IX]